MILLLLHHTFLYFYSNGYEKFLWVYNVKDIFLYFNWLFNFK